MSDELTQKITQRLAELPDDVRQAVQSADMAKKIEALGAKYKLHVDQVGELEDETLMTMLGFTTLESFEQRAATALHLPAETAKQVAEDVNRDIFLAVRASLRRFTEEKAAPKPVVPSAPAAMHPADVMLSQKTVTIAPLMPPKPEPYKADPYREPTE
jgi:hypothetical protein